MKTLLLALEIGLMQPGQAYQHLALHCTLAHRFKTDWPIANIVEAAAPILQAAGPITLTSGAEDLFGPSDGPRTISVNHIEKTPELTALHMALYNKLNTLNVIHTEPAYAGADYAPHVPAQGGQRLAAGQTHTAKAVYLIEILGRDIPKRKLIHTRLPL